MSKMLGGSTTPSIMYDHLTIEVASRQRISSFLIGVALVGIVTLAVAFRLYRLDTFLHWAFGDEMSYGIEGQNIIHGKYTSLFAYTWDQAPATYAYLLAMAQHSFGATLQTDREVSVVTGTLTVILLALCARELEISWTGSLLAAALLAVSHWHAHFSRMALPATTTAFVLLVAVYSMLIAFRHDRWWLYGLAGFICGCAPYMFLSNRIFPAILILWFAYLAIFHRRWVQRNWSKILLFSTVYVLVLVPLARFWLGDTDWFMGPQRHVGIMYNLSYWAGQHPGESTALWNVLWHQLPLALGMFVVNGGPYPPWGGTYGPAMDVVTGWLLFAGVIFAFTQWHRPLVMLVLIWATLIWFFGVVLTLDAPQMEHAVGMLPAIFLLIAVLVDALGEVLILKTKRPGLYAGVAILLATGSGILNFQTYFQTWGSQLAGQGGFSWQAYDAAVYVGHHSTPHGTAIYSWGYPDEFFRFLAPHAHEFGGVDAKFRRASLYIVLAGTSASPQAIAAQEPHAHLEQVYDTDGDLAFTAILPQHP